jgi:serine/threonine protein kinase
VGDIDSKALAPARGANDAAITGVRKALPNTGTIDVPSNDPQRFPLESWDADEAAESVPPVVKGELLGGKYVVEGMFAEGGMGIVCLGRHAQLNQPVAIKFLRRALSGRDSIIERFLDEARALAALRSEHVVRVMDVGQLESGRPYLVMEHLDGIDLSVLLERDGPLGVDKAVSYVLQVCDALAEAHALGIVHRDIKPENLFLWSGGTGSDVVKVLDFGLAKRLDSGHALGATGPQDSMGSPWYMSPEQIVTPQAVDSRTDVWSLGVVLYQLLTDTVPFEGRSRTIRMTARQGRAPARPRTVYGRMARCAAVVPPTARLRRVAVEEPGATTTKARVLGPRALPRLLRTTKTARPCRPER